MANAPYDVAVIGAGATGAALTVQLVRQLPAGRRVLLLGTPRETARGVAYGTTLPGHLLNVRAGRMSAIHDEPGHFVRWLVDAGWGGGDAAEIAEAYVPRTVYGSYLEDTLGRAVAAARKRVAVDTVAGTATGIERRDGIYRARLADGEVIEARALALCLGHGRPEFPIPAEAVDPAARERMIADPWNDRRMAAIGADDRVLMVGTGLTMIDQVLALSARGHRGAVVALSRRGFVPRAHCLARTEPYAIALPEGRLGAHALVRHVVAAARDTVDAGGDWRAVVDGLRPVTQDIWQRLDIADRRRFCRHVESLWSSVRHRMAPEVARRIAAARDDGLLEVRAGRIVTVKGSRDGLVAALRARGSRTVELARFDWIVNCSGTGRIVVDAAEGVLAPLVAAGLLAADRLRRGIAVTREGQVLGRDGTPTEALYALGPPGAGSLGEITAMPDIREQCAAAAGLMAATGRGRGAEPRSALVALPGG